MAEKHSATVDEIESIHNTLGLRDPNRQTILVGSAAIVAHFHDIQTESPISCNDIDALCTPAFFNGLLANFSSLKQASSVQYRWPKNRLAARGARNTTIDIYPEENLGLLPFTVAKDMSDLFVSTTYEESKEAVVEVAGIQCVPLEYILRWAATIGREKDIATVNAILSPAFELGLISAKDRDITKSQLDNTIALRQLHPERY